MIYTMRELRKALRQCSTITDVDQVKAEARPFARGPKSMGNFAVNPYRWKLKIARKEREING